MTKQEKQKAVVHPYNIDELRKDQQFKHVGGSDFDTFNHHMVNQAMNSLMLDSFDEKWAEKQRLAVLCGLMGIAPRDELEGMLAAQLLACHNAAMECYRRAMLPNQPLEGRNANLSQANRLSRTYASLLESLNRHRGKGQQKMTVEHVHVHEGGQAIVGNVRQGGGSDKKEKEQPNAKEIHHAPQPEVRCDDKEREPVPIARDAKR